MFKKALDWLKSIFKKPEVTQVSTPFPVLEGKQPEPITEPKPIKIKGEPKATPFYTAKEWARLKRRRVIAKLSRKKNRNK